MADNQQPTQVFISHATKDGKLARQLANDLHKEGFKVWIATDSILPGEGWVEAISRGLETSEILLVLLSHQAVESKWVRAEMDVAIDRERAGNIQIIPLQIEVCETPLLWQRYQFIPFQIYQVGWKALLTSLRGSAAILSPTLFPVEISLITKLYAPGGVGSLAFAPTGNLIAGSRVGSIHEWELPSGQETKITPAHEEPLTDISISPKGDLLATSSQDNLIKLWSFPNFKSVVTLVGHSGTVNAIDFSFDGNNLVSGSRDTTVCVWSIPDGRCLRTLKKHTNSVYGVSFSPKDNLIASASSDNSIILWSEEDGFEGSLLGKPGSTTLIRTVFSPGGNLLAAGTWSGVIRLWDIEERKGAGILEGHIDRVYGLAFAPSGSILASGSKDGYLRLWKIPGKDLAYPPIKEHAGWVRALAFSPDGNFLATGDSDGIIVLWKIKTI